MFRVPKRDRPYGPLIGEPLYKTQGAFMSESFREGKGAIFWDHVTSPIRTEFKACWPMSLR